MTTTYDVVIVGGGPAGSTCARTLTAAGARVAIIDRATFPRVKLCAGWISPAIWDELRLSPSEYPHGLWEWHTCHIHYQRTLYSMPCHGWFIRRYQLDDFLLQRSGAELHLGFHAKRFERDADGLWHIGGPIGEHPDGLRARYLVGAGGTNCPVARLLAPARPRSPLGAQELELQTDLAAVERTRVGRDGEPELLLFDDVGGYGWNVPKSDWLNVGCGTLDASRVRGAWRATHEQLGQAGHLPAEAEPALEHMKGHSYYLFEPAHLDGAHRDNALLVGDSLGLAHPITGEGILPATVSGRVAAEAILANDPAGYAARLRRDPVIADYLRVYHLLEAGRRLKRRVEQRPAASERGAARGPAAWGGRIARDLGKRAVARGFVWMFSGAKLPAPRLLDRVLRQGG